MLFWDAVWESKGGFKCEAAESQCLQKVRQGKHDGHCEGHFGFLYVF